MSTTVQFQFPPEVQAYRAGVLIAIRRATADRTLAAVQEAQRLSAAWLSEHPEDYAVWDAGGTLSLLEDALLTTAPLQEPLTASLGTTARR